jgi:hypothetical protein
MKILTREEVMMITIPKDVLRIDLSHDKKANIWRLCFYRKQGAASQRINIPDDVEITEDFVVTENTENAAWRVIHLARM